MSDNEVFFLGFLAGALVKEEEEMRIEVGSCDLANKTIQVRDDAGRTFTLTIKEEK